MQRTDCEFVGRDFRDDDLSRLQIETTASLTRARIDIEQALAYAAAHGLRFDSAGD